jgi:hypothetical protein
MVERFPCEVYQSGWCDYSTTSAFPVTSISESDVVAAFGSSTPALPVDADTQALV